MRTGESDVSEHELPRELRLAESGPNRYRVNHPENDPEGREVVFSGQLLAQSIMASDALVDGAKGTQSIHTIFSRVGSYASPLELQVEVAHDGRAFASHTTTATQGERLIARSLVLMSADEPDLIRHSPAMPDVPAPTELEPAAVLAFPGLETRPVPSLSGQSSDGSPVESFWMRNPNSYDSVAANQAILAWSQPGSLIGLAMRPHSDVVNIHDAHRTASTGVVAHTSHFHEPFDVAEWLLVAQEAIYAGRGRVFGIGSVFTRNGDLVSTFEQDSMVRSPPARLTSRNAM
jgi:acyl-CoA thioesterase II